MPLGKRLSDTNRSRLCGVETEFEHRMENSFASHLVAGGFDFVVAPLMDPAYRPSLAQQYQFGSFADLLPFTRSDLSLKPVLWNSHVVGKISTWIDLDSEDETLRMDSEAVLKQEISWATYLSLQACLLPAPKGTSWANYARCVNQILHGLKNMQLWLRIPLGTTDADSCASSSTLVDSWEVWNSFRLLCEHHSKLLVVLDNLSILPSDKSLERWYGEHVVASIIHTDSFLTNDRGNLKFLPVHHQRLITDFFNHSIQIIISGKQVHPQAIVVDPYDACSAADSDGHPLRPYLDYVGSLYQQMDPLSEKECFEFGFRDLLQPLVQPIKNNIEALTYLKFEKDIKKYDEYKKAIGQALLDRVPDEQASLITTVVVVVGAGRGPLVQASVQAAQATGRKIRVYALEKNPHAIPALTGLMVSDGYKDIVTVTKGDVRSWNAPEAVDILVSELLGSFGDNELSPECLDSAQRFLKIDGISIPSSYTSFLQPVTASKLYKDIKEDKDILRFETPYVVKIHNVARLAPSQPVFTFTHPKTEANYRHKKVEFVIPESAMVHGFAGYFDATLYKDVHLGTEPSSATPDVCNVFSIKDTYLCASWFYPGSTFLAPS